jgi:hypothetical protein
MQAVSPSKPEVVIVAVRIFLKSIQPGMQHQLLEYPSEFIVRLIAKSASVQV